MVYIKDLFKKIAKYDVGYLYVVRCGDYFKVGTASLPEQRLQLIRTDNPLPIEVLCVKKTPQLRNIEAAIHSWLKEDGYHVRGEWFRYTEQIANLVLSESGTLTDEISNSELLEILE